MFTQLLRQWRRARELLSTRKATLQAVWEEYMEADRQWLLNTFGFDPFDKGEKHD